MLDVELSYGSYGNILFMVPLTKYLIHAGSGLNPVSFWLYGLVFVISNGLLFSYLGRSIEAFRTWISQII